MNMQVEALSSKSYINKMHNDGFCVFSKKINSEKIQLLTAEVYHVRQIVMQKIASMERPLKTYSDIAERHLGRLDYRCGFTADIFNEVAQPIIKIIRDLSPNVDFKHYWGVVTSLGKSEPTNMHRDVYPILNTMKGMDLDTIDINLPPYYFTVLIPLVKLTQENGPTEFIKGSHLHPNADENSNSTYAPLLQPGDFVVFDGRTMHRGLANQTNTERLIAYITFRANWYHDQTFITNNYLFPELSVKEK
jgi:ectoine hydroxylase-related dioxygenase (phytanoyl-CoA dioxygenase family)